MEETFERVTERRVGKLVPVRHFYRRQYQNSTGDWRTIYYGIFTDKKGIRRKFPLGSEIKAAKEALALYEARNVKREDFDADKVRQKPTPEGERMTLEKWSGIYLDLEEVRAKAKSSYERDRQLIKPLNRLLGSILLMDLTRDDLLRYRKRRLGENIIRGKNGAAKKTVSPGTVANELSSLRHQLNMAFMHKDDKYKDEDGIEHKKFPQLKDFRINVSFKKLIVRSQRDRILDADEERAFMEAYPTWLKRIAIVAAETCLSQGDIIRLTRNMIDRKLGEIVPEGGRLKTGVEQRAPLTDSVLEIIDEIEREKHRGAIVANVNGLVFTRDDGRAITKDMITQAVRVARKRAGVADFRFHDYRHSAKTSWSRQGVHVDVAMKAAGHKSVAMHQRYVNLKPGDIAKAFGICSPGVTKHFPASKQTAASS